MAFFFPGSRTGTQVALEYHRKAMKEQTRRIEKEGIEMERILKSIVELIESAIDSWCSTMWACS